MGHFVDYVRASKIPHPTQQKFNIEIWNETFNSFAPHGEDDQNLYEAGLWIFHKLDAIRSRISEICFNAKSKSNLVRYFCGYINRTAHIVSQKKVPLVSNDLYIAESLIQMKTPENVTQPDVTPDEIITEVVDGARYALSITQKLTEKSLREKESDLEVLGKIKTTMALAGLYDSIETIWMDCLWLGKYIKKDGEYEFIVDTDIEGAINLAVSNYRRQSLILGFNTISKLEWNSMSEEVKREVYSNTYGVKIVRQQKKKELSLSSMKYDKESPPTALLMRLLAQESYFQNLLTVKLPKFSNFTLDQLIASWEILYSLSTELLSMFPVDSGVYKLNKALQYAPTIAKEELAKLFSQALQLNFKQGHQLVNILCFPEDPRKELWFHPLVEVDKRTVCILVPSVMFQNLMRTIEYWLANGGVNIDSKGGEFEKEIIDELKESINEAILHGKLKDIQIFTTSKKLLGEQIDVIIKLRNTFLIGEAKCSIYPAKPLEFHNYYELIKKDAATQIKRKVEFISNNRKKFLKVVGLSENLNLHTIRFLPFILTNHPYCVGFPVEGIPVVDKYILQRYIYPGEHERFVFFDIDGKKTVGERLPFYSNEEEAENNMEGYLLNPPQLELFKKFIKRRVHRIPTLKEGETKVAYVAVDVELPLPPEYKGH